MSHYFGDQRALTLVISLCLTYTICLAAIRIWIRRRAYGFDDAVIAVAILVGLGHNASQYIAVRQGLGTSWKHLVDGQSMAELNITTLASITTFIIALYLSKCATLSLLTRITKCRSQILLYHTCNITVAFLGIASLLVVLLKCPSDSGYYWNIHGNEMRSCPGEAFRWQIFTAFDVVTEILLLVLPFRLVWTLQMSFRKRSAFTVAFLLRAPLIGLSIGRNHYILQLRLSSSDPGFLSAIVIIWLEVQLAYSLAAGTLSASQGFIETFNSGFGLGFARAHSEYGSSRPSSSARRASERTSKGADGFELDNFRSQIHGAKGRLALRMMEEEDITPVSLPTGRRAGTRTPEPVTPKMYNWAENISFGSVLSLPGMSGSTSCSIHRGGLAPKVEYESV